MKNILLVMSSSGYLVPPSGDPSQDRLWVETWKRIDRFLPDLRKELDLDPKEKPEEKPEEKLAEQPQEPQELQKEESAVPVTPVS